jgi:CRP/FNR family transcriptional regulator, anaerobic regulatory protein
MTVMVESLIKVIAKSVTTTAADIDLCTTYFEPHSYLKNSIIEENDKIPKRLYFIVAGFMRLFYCDSNGDEVTNHITTPGNFIAPFLSLINETKAVENVACITDCTLLSITRANMVALIDKSENFKKFSLIIFEQAMASGTKRADELATLSAEQRYRKLLTEQPEILQNIPIQYIASYLGIKPQSLSRIRRQLI